MRRLVEIVLLSASLLGSSHRAAGSGGAPARGRDAPGLEGPIAFSLFQDEAAGEDHFEDEEEESGRTFFYKELVLSGLYVPGGVRGIPADDRSKDRFEFSPRPPGNYVGFEYIQTFTPSSPINRKVLPDGFQLAALDLHPRFVYDALEPRDDLNRLDFAPQDFWARFTLGGDDRLSLRVGQFVLPYGANPIRSPRQQVILPVESLDLGLKWDWGLALKGPAGEYDWELAATIGSGEALHSSRFFRGKQRASYLVSGRIGAPTYWDFQYGFSFLFGDLPLIRASNVFSDASISRWRIALDVFEKYGTYLTMGGQVTWGQDGFAGDAEFNPLPRGETAHVLGYRAWLDWVLPGFQDLRLGTQLESVIRDTARGHRNDTELIFEVNYSISTAVALKLDYRQVLARSPGALDDALFLTLVFYGF